MKTNWLVSTTHLLARMEQMVEDMNRMRITAKALVGVGDEDNNTFESKEKITTVSESRSEAEDSHYAGSYAHFGIHHEMLSDRVRTESYRDALQHATGPVRGKSVLDLGCGTGILSMFCAAQAGGASAVTGVDMSDIVHQVGQNILSTNCVIGHPYTILSIQAMDIVRENSLETTIALLKGRLEDISELNGRKFDVIVSEWMGYFLLFEGMLDSVLAARDKYLKPGGSILPSRCSLHVTALSDIQRYNNLVGFWTDVYGFKMSCMRGPILGEANVEVVGSEHIVSNSQRVHDLDITTCTVADTEFSSDFSLEISRTCDLTAIVGYFDTFFELEERPVEFSTGPLATPTHWKQTVFYLPEVLPVVKDQVVSGKITCKRMSTDVRALKVALTLEGRQYRYTVD